MTRTTLTATCVVGMAATAAQADILQLTNGNHVRGVILEHNERGLRMAVGLHMQVLYAAREIARVERESEEDNARLRESWGATPGSDSTSRTSRTAYGSWDGGGGEPSGAAQRRREEIILTLDMEETLTTPEALATQLGRPQLERTTRSRAGQAILEWGYDIGDGLLRIVQFRKMPSGYMATGTYEERKGDNPSTPATASAREEEPHK